jgi:transposase
MKQTLQHQAYASEPVLYMALELSAKNWKLGFGDGSHQRQKTVRAGDQGGLLAAVSQAKQKFGLPGNCRVISGYEAGRDGFWIHRWLISEGIENRVMDASSIERPRRGRVAKTDRLDAGKLLLLLIRKWGGEHRAFSTVRVPSREVEAMRRLHRERQRLLKERTAHSNRMSSLLVTHGVTRLCLWGDFDLWLSSCRDGEGKPLPAELVRELIREHQRWLLVVEQVKALESQQQALLETGEHRCHEQARRLRILKGLDVQTPWVLAHEVFWRPFRNGKEVGAMAGLVPTPHSSGELSRELGISKAGNPRVRSTMIELAWLWVRWQPESELTQWFERRFAHGGKRMRRIGIVALARKLLIALWRYVETGEIPAGAVLKAT